MANIKYLVLKALLLLSILYSNIIFSQVYPSKDSLYSYTRFLSSKEMSGRFPGTDEDSIAIKYISGKFKDYGLKSIIGDSFIQYFSIPLHRIPLSSSELVINNIKLRFGEDFYIYPSSPNTEYKRGIGVYSQESINRKDSTNYIKILKRGVDSIPNIASKYFHQGFKAVVIVADDSTYSSLEKTVTTSFKLTIPVFIIPDSLFADCCSDSIKINFVSKTDILNANTANIIGVTEGDYDNYIVVGAHYDHLGSNKEFIYYGADDNASGVASLLELSRIITPSKNLGVIYIAFGAEERGLLGSKVAVDALNDMGILSKIKLMINLDMVGRMRDDKLQIAGVGSFSLSDSLINTVNNKFNLSISKIRDGSGASDHASFYNQNIPVLFLSTGVHSDYHTTGDTYDKINYHGLKTVTEFTKDIIYKASSNHFVIDFVKSDVPNMGRASFNVTLGITPDFTYDNGDGFKVGPVSKGRPAEKGGVLQGDIITKINDFTIKNIYDYMEALSKLEKDDRVIIHIKRDESIIVLEFGI